MDNNLKNHFVATVHIVVPADDEGTASDAIAEPMRNLEQQGLFLDWGYANHQARMKDLGIINTSTYDEGDFISMVENRQPPQPTTVRELPEQPLRYLQNKRGDFINMNGMDICEVLTMKGAMGAELVRRYNIYPELLTALKDIVHGDQVGMGKKAMDLRFDIANDLIEKIEAV